MNDFDWRMIPYGLAAVLILGGIVALSAMTERAKFLDCRGAGHSVGYCVVREML